MPCASPATVCYKSLPQVTALVLSGSPGAWNFPVPASFYPVSPGPVRGAPRKRGWGWVSLPGSEAHLPCWRPPAGRVSLRALTPPPLGAPHPRSLLCHSRPSCFLG